LAAQGFLAAQGLQAFAAQGFLAAHGLQPLGAHGFFAAHGFAIAIFSRGTAHFSSDADLAPHGLQGEQAFLAAHGLHDFAAHGFLAAHGFFAAQGLQAFAVHGLQLFAAHGFLAAQGFLTAHGFFAAQGLQADFLTAHGFAEHALLGAQAAKSAVGSATVAMEATPILIMIGMTDEASNLLLSGCIYVFLSFFLRRKGFWQRTDFWLRTDCRHHIAF
jgi:hypothetical protein